MHRSIYRFRTTFCRTFTIVRHLQQGPDLAHFIRKQQQQRQQPFVMKWQEDEENGTESPYLEPESLHGQNRRVHIKTYGCQMNVNDTDIAASILIQNGYQITDSMDEAEIVFLMTCAIRDHAENKVWTKLKELDREKRRGRLQQFGLLGCMAERLKTRILDELPDVDIVAGPDSYRHLPKLLAVNRATGQSAVNVLLSLDETYEGVLPRQSSSATAYVSITRGCNNMCTYCIVPYTRGRERSRTIDSILEQTQRHIDAGAREIILLGQNVNSYRDHSSNDSNDAVEVAPGFRTIYKRRPGGHGFDVLLDQVARLDPNVRIRFTSPHPKDFTESVLRVIADHPNIAKGLHLPVQSGSDRVLERMRRGYTRQAYMDLVEKIHHIIPECGLSSDFICGFCGETEEDHRETVQLVDQVGYLIAYIFAYSMRSKTYAYHHLKDDVPQQVKIQRLIELNQVYRERSLKLNRNLIGKQQLVLLENESKKSPEEWYGRNEANQKVIVPKCSNLQMGDFVAVKITDCTSVTLIGQPVSGPTSIKEFYRNNISSSH